MAIRQVDSATLQLTTDFNRCPNTVQLGDHHGGSILSDDGLPPKHASRRFDGSDRAT
jgi:hypothetical protein